MRRIACCSSTCLYNRPGHVALSVGHLTHKSEVLGSIPSLATYFLSPSADSRGAVVSYWEKYVHEVLVNHLGGLSLPRKSVVRLTDRPDMILDVYRGRKTTTQQQQQLYNRKFRLISKCLETKVFIVTTVYCMIKLSK